MQGAALALVRTTCCLALCPLRNTQDCLALESIATLVTFLSCEGKGRRSRESARGTATYRVERRQVVGVPVPTCQHALMAATRLRPSGPRLAPSKRTHSSLGGRSGGDGRDGGCELLAQYAELRHAVTTSQLCYKVPDPFVDCIQASGSVCCCRLRSASPEDVNESVLIAVLWPEGLQRLIERIRLEGRAL